MSQEYPGEQFGIDRLTGDHIPGYRALSYPQRRRVKKALFYIGLLGALAIFLFPVFWMFNTAIRPPSDMFSKPVTLIPAGVTLVHFEGLMEGHFPRWYFNSIIYALAVVVLTVSASTLGGYGLTRLNIPHKKKFATGIIFGYMFPPILLAIPMYIFWRQLNILNTYFGLVLALAAFQIPFALWLMWKFFQTVPYSLEESARMSGANRFRAAYDIALPMAKPGMIAVAVQAYAFSWNEFTVPKILVPEITRWPFTVGLFSFTQQNQILWGQMMMASALAVIPALVFVYFLEKYLLKGFQTAGV